MFSFNNSIACTVTQQVEGFSQRPVPARLLAPHPCPHATVAWSPLVGGTRQYVMYTNLNVYVTIVQTYLRLADIPWSIAMSQGRL